VTQSSSQVEQPLPPTEETPQQPKKNRFFAFLGFLIFAFAVMGFGLDLFEMGRVFWGVFILWLLVVRLIIVIKQPKVQSGEQQPEQALLVSGI
jgi:predicted lipid-binding transport protein (Tim44 family)